MKNVLLLTLLISPVSVFSMDEVRDLAVSEEGEHFGASSDNDRSKSDRELENAFIAFKPGLSEIESSRQIENASMAAKAVGMQKIDQDGGLEEVYATIIGENFNLITDCMLAEQLDHRVSQLWTRQTERIKREALAAFKKNGAIKLMEDTIKANLSDNVAISAQHISTLAYAACNGVIENIIAAGPSALKSKINSMRKENNACYKSKKTVGYTHHTVQ